MHLEYNTVSIPAQKKMVEQDQPTVSLPNNHGKDSSRRPPSLHKRGKAKGRSTPNQSTEEKEVSGSNNSEYPEKKSFLAKGRGKGKAKRSKGTTPPKPKVDLSRDIIFCPICTEKFDEVELGFIPCPCEYRVCAMCIHLIKEKADGKCPNCRELYLEVRQKVMTQPDRQLVRLFRQVTREEELEKQKQAQQELRRSVFQARSNRPRMLDERRLNQVLNKHKHMFTSTTPSENLSPDVSSVTPVAPCVKLTRFTGGLSVWD